MLSTKPKVLGALRMCRSKITNVSFPRERIIQSNHRALCASVNFYLMNKKLGGEKILASSPVESIKHANPLGAEAQEHENRPDTSLNLSSESAPVDEQLAVISESAPAIESAEKISSTWDFLWSSDIVWPNVQAAQELLGYVHETSGLPWWMTLCLVTFTTRTCILPFAAYQQQVGGRLQRALPQLQQVEQEFMVASNVYKDPGASTRRKSQKAEIYATHNCHPWKLFAFALVQAPLFVSYFFAVKGLGDRFESFTSGGLLWFTDLTVQDPYFLLPVAAGLSMMGMLEVNVRARRFTMPEKQYKIMSGVQRIMCFSMIPLLAGMKYPAGVFVYWISNNLFSILQVTLFNQPSVRQWLGLPPLKNVASAVPFDPFLSKPK